MAEAQAVLGQWLLDGRGTAADASAALGWFEVAARQGHAMAMNMAGRCHEHGWGTAADAAQAACRYADAARAGLDWGMYNLANLLATGRGLTLDQRSALAWYRKAADLGHARSMNMVGRYLEEGLVVSRDTAQAMDWYRRSAEAGDFRGQFSYAGMLAEAGRIDEAVGWLEKMPSGATPTFLAQAIQALSASPMPRLRELGERMHRASTPDRP